MSAKGRGSMNIGVHRTLVRSQIKIHVYPSNLIAVTLRICVSIPKVFVPSFDGSKSDSIVISSVQLYDVQMQVTLLYLFVSICGPILHA